MIRRKAVKNTYSILNLFLLKKQESKPQSPHAMDGVERPIILGKRIFAFSHIPTKSRKCQDKIGGKWHLTFRL
jgi:hypothetical protein